LNQDQSTQLLHVLQSHLNDPEATFSSRPKRLSGGVFSEVYGISLSSEGRHRPMVLRLYSAGTDPIQPRLEQAVQDGLADAHFPAPRVILADNDPGRLGSMFVVMERLPGRGFLRGVRPDQFVPDFPKLCLRWPRVLLEVAERLHHVDPAPVLAAAARCGIQTTQLTVRRHVEFVTANFEAFGGDRTQDALAWLGSREPTPVDVPSIIHGDLWPANVLMRRGHLTGLVDWTMGGIGDPALDVGYACAGLAMMPAPLPPPPPIRQGIHAAGKNLARRIREQYCERTHTTAERIEFYEALRCLVELSAVLAYRHRSKGTTSAAAQRPPWDKGVRALVRHFQRISGVPIAIE
jgi:aminoglycoside phosphotransferase (APT) family kinase protein